MRKNLALTYFFLLILLGCAYAQTDEAPPGILALQGTVLASDQDFLLETEKGEIYLLKGDGLEKFADSLVALKGELISDQLGNVVLRVLAIEKQGVGK
jgi:hypothetical protein